LYLAGTHHILTRLADTYLKRYHIKYKKISGDIFSFVRVSGVSYKDKMLMDAITVRYSLKDIFEKNIKIKSIKIDHPRIKNIELFLGSLKPDKKSAKSDISIDIDNVKIDSLSYTLGKLYIDEANLSVKDLSYHDKSISIGSLAGEGCLRSADRCVRVDVDMKLRYRLDDKKLRYEGVVKLKDIEGLKKGFEPYFKESFADFKGSEKEADVSLKSKFFRIDLALRDNFSKVESRFYSDIANVDTNVTLNDKNGSFVAFGSKSLPNEYKKLFPIKGVFALKGEKFLLKAKNRYFDEEIQGDLKDKSLRAVSKRMKLSCKVRFEKDGAEFNLDADSLSALYKALNPLYELPLKRCDGKINIQGTYYKKKVEAKVSIPWFVKSISKKENLILKKGDFDLSLDKNSLKVASYSLQTYYLKRFVKLFSKDRVSFFDFDKKSFSLSVDSDGVASTTDGYIKDKSIYATTKLLTREGFMGVLPQKVFLKSNYDMSKKLFYTKIDSSLRSKYAEDIALKADLKVDKDSSLRFKGVIEPKGLRGSDKEVLRLFEDGKVDFEGDKKEIEANFKNKNLNIKASWRYGKNFIEMKLKSAKLKASRWLGDESALRECVFSVDANGTVNIKDINSTIWHYRIDSNMLNISGIGEIKQLKTKALVELPKNSILKSRYKSIRLKYLFPIRLESQRSGDKLLLTLKDTKAKANVSYELSKKVFDLSVDGLGGASLKAKGDIKEFEYSIGVNSLRESLNSIKDVYRVIDGEVDSTFFINGKYQKGRVEARLTAPWFLYRVGFDKYFFVKDIKSSIFYHDDTIKISRYEGSAYILDNYRKIYSHKTSTLKLKKEKIEVESYLNDNIKIYGTLGKKDNLRMFTKKIHIKEPEADVDVGLDLVYEKDEKESSIEGKVYLLGGKVMYKPKKTYQINDPDIVFVDNIQTTKKGSKGLLKVLVNIIAKDKLVYVDGKNRVVFKNDISFFRYKGEKLGVYGYVKIFNGVYFSEGKRFDIGEGRLMFDGNYLNPYINLKAFYKKDPYLVTIRIGGRLATPIVSFSSTPYLSQNDILSLLIFNSTFSSLSSGKKISTNQALSLFGNSFAKSLADSLGINLDRVQLLTTDEGTLGFVVEKRLSKKISIVYQNNIVQSITVRYKHSKHFETDVTYSPESSGIELLYNYK